jgi:hypothetical protein
VSTYENYNDYLKDQQDRFYDQAFDKILDDDVTSPWSTFYDAFECGVSEDHDWKPGDYECRRCGADLSAWNEEEEE